MLQLSQLLITQLIPGFVFAFMAAFMAYHFKLLTLGGAAAAFCMGWIVFGLGGWQWALVLIAFFASSSGFSLFFKKHKKQVEKMYAKGGTRDHTQVLANGGVATMFVLLTFFLPELSLGWIGFCAALAAANADTWATELGIFNRRKPVLIIGGRAVEPGTSGAISLVGTLSAAAGAAFIALLAWLLEPESTIVSSVVLIFCSGLFGSLVDSLFGATLQGIYFCPDCRKETEKHPLHGCGAQTSLIRGKAWLTNEWVNTFCTLSASITAVVFTLILKIG